MDSLIQWFGVKIKSETKTGKMLIDLTKLYKDAITKYFDIYSASAEDFIMQIKKTELKPGDKHFIEWFEETGIINFRNILSINFDFDEEQLEAYFDYAKFILEAEMDFIYPQDVRSVLLDIGKRIPEWIEIIRTFQESSVTKIDIVWDVNFDDYLYNLGNLQEKPFLLMNLGESDYKTDSLIFSMEECYYELGRIQNCKKQYSINTC